MEQSEIEDITPKQYKCGDMDALCPAIYKLKSGSWAVAGRVYGSGELEYTVTFDPQMMIDALREQGLLTECSGVAKPCNCAG